MHETIYFDALYEMWLLWFFGSTELGAPRVPMGFPRGPREICSKPQGKLNETLMSASLLFTFVRTSSLLERGPCACSERPTPGLDEIKV